jgi:hypothetical protein
MALARKLPHFHTGSSSHRLWHDIGGANFVSCTAATEVDLIHLAGQADRIVLREAPGKQSDPRTAAQIRDGLHAAKLLLSGTVMNPDVALNRLKIVLGDRLARTRIVDGRHALAGLVELSTNDVTETVLLVVLACRHVCSCDWLLTPAA